MDMNKYNKLQALRAKLSAVDAKLHDMAVCGRDLPFSSKERKVMQEQYRITARGRAFYADAVAQLVKEVSVDY